MMSVLVYRLLFCGLFLVSVSYLTNLQYEYDETWWVVRADKKYFIVLEKTFEQYIYIVIHTLFWLQDWLTKITE